MPPHCANPVGFATAPPQATELTAADVEGNGIALTWKSNNTDDARLQFALYRDCALVPRDLTQSTFSTQMSS